jgi:Zn-dependent protease/CBS domain-containing protein
MQASLRLGRVAGIPVGLHFSWLIIATLITLSLAAHFGATNPAWSGPAVWGSAVVTAILFFATLLAHELSHALVARARGLPVRSITLFALGGIAQMERDAATARTEFWMAIAGPVTSVVIGVLCIASALALGWSLEGSTPSPLAAILGWLGSINIVLAVFNLIPGYPLDGGRVLRAILWGISGDADRATRSASRVGQVVAVLFIVFGLMRFLSGGGFGGLWLTFIGWFLLNAAQASYAEVALAARLRGVTVGDVMATDCPTVAAGMDLQSFVDELLLRTGRRCFLVTGPGGLVGLITPNEVRSVDRSRWPEVRVDEVMRPLDRVVAVSPETTAIDALALMAREDVNQIPVVREGRLAGLVTRAHLLQLVESRAELEV